MKGVIYMLDIEKLMREGKSLDEIGKMVTAEMNAAQTKIDAEKKAKAEAAKLSKRKTDARNAVIAALTDYFTLVLPMSKDIDMNKIVTEALDSLEETIKLMENVTVKVNGSKPMGLFDLLDL